MARELHKDITGRVIVIVPDKDEAGKRHAELVANSISGHARTASFVDWYDAWPQGAADESVKVDAAEFFGATMEET